MAVSEKIIHADMPLLKVSHEVALRVSRGQTASNARVTGPAGDGGQRASDRRVFAAAGELLRDRRAGGSTLTNTVAQFSGRHMV